MLETGCVSKMSELLRMGGFQYRVHKLSGEEPRYTPPFICVDFVEQLFTPYPPVFIKMQVEDTPGPGALELHVYMVSYGEAENATLLRWATAGEMATRQPQHTTHYAVNQWLEDIKALQGTDSAHRLPLWVSIFDCESSGEIKRQVPARSSNCTFN